MRDVHASFAKMVVVPALTLYSILGKTKNGAYVYPYSSTTVSVISELWDYRAGI